MKKTNKEENPWDDTPAQAEPQAEVETKLQAPQAPQALNAPEYDLEGLMTDFPTARELERFVFDETGIVLSLKGRANKLKYQVAMDVLNGIEIDSKFIGSDNPYIDKTDLVPIDPIKDAPARDPKLPPRAEVQNSFFSPVVPHPDATERARDAKVHMVFRKYKSGEISFEILGPISPRPHGSKIDKYGRERPEVIKMIDPRTGEQLAQREDGTLTPQGKRLRAMMQTFKVNRSNFWDTWVDREFVSLNDSVANNPWDLSK